jgi:hypothetical protein
MAVPHFLKYLSTHSTQSLIAIVFVVSPALLAFASTVASSSAFAVSQSAQNKSISDELVTHLSCVNLTPASIYQAIRPTAFDPNRRIEADNYYLNDLGQCWSLARFQRLNLLLGRETLQHQTKVVDRIARGFDYVPLFGGPLEIRKPLTNLWVFGMPKDKSRYYNAADWVDSVVAKRTNFRPDSSSFFEAIEQSQLRLFFRPKNLSLIGETLSYQAQRSELNQIFQLANRKMLPLMVMRFRRFAQHVVAVKAAYRTSPTSWSLSLVDSNGTGVAHDLEISLRSGKFELCKRNNSNPSTRCELDDEAVQSVRLVEENERPMIDDALVRYYRSQCGN